MSQRPSFSCRPDAGVDLSWPGGPALQGCTAVVHFRAEDSRHTLPLLEPGPTVSGPGIRASWHWEAEEDGLRVWVELTCSGDTALSLEAVDVLSAPGIDLGVPAEEWSVYQNGWASWTPTLARHLIDSLYADPGTPAYRAMHQPHQETETDGVISSEWVTVVTHRAAPQSARPSLLVGFVTASDQLGEIRLRSDGSQLVARCHFDGALLAPGNAVRSETLLLRAGARPLDLLEHWADAVAQEMEARVPAAQPTGWCTWYYFYGENTADDVVQNVAAIERLGLPLDVILLDDGYQTAIGDWFSLDAAKFPDGLDPVRQAVSQAGHRVGIWTAPFGAAANSALFAQHPDWLLRDERGEPVVGWTHWGTDCYSLDCTHPEVLDWLRESFRRMRTEWGVQFFKIDFIFAAARPGRRHDPASTRAQALRRGVAAVREGIGDDAFLLGCGAPLGPCVGLVDGMRVGPDVDPNWHPIWRHDLSMPSIENALRNSLARAPFHGRLWANDPDCLLVRQRGPDLDLVLNEMRTLSALTALLGGSTINSDHLPAARPGRLKYLRQALPPTGVSARPLDLFEQELPRLHLLSVECDWGRWWVLGVVNWEDHTVETTVRLADLGLPSGRYHVYRYWRRRYLGTTEHSVTIRRHQPHETAVLLLKPVAERPDLLTTTFHVCQGMVEVGHCEWRAEDSTLRVALHKAGRQFGQVLFVAPAGWAAVEARVDDARRPLTQIAPGVVSLGLTLAGQAMVEVQFAGSEQTERPALSGG